jgi:nicotinamide-nucleotide amidase
MPPNNEIQCWFPAGSRIIDNPEGTAPGIDLSGVAEADSAYRIFALPGVPVEMQQMWQATVEPALREMIGNNQVIHHHTIHCFGAGESHIETLLPDVVRRGRDPQVGITASAATISLRISTRGETVEQCLEKMQPTVSIIEECLGDLVFGQNGQELQDVVVELLAERGNTLAILDAGLEGAVAKLIASSRLGEAVLAQSEISGTPRFDHLCEVAAEIARRSNSNFGLAIGTIDRDADSIALGRSIYRVGFADSNQKFQQEFRFSGHSGWREVRAIKEALNFLRLQLAKSSG